MQIHDVNALIKGMNKELNLKEVKSPPCDMCHHFKSKVETQLLNGDLTVTGVRFCHAVEMEFDFGCFMMREWEGPVWNVEVNGVPKWCEPDDHNWDHGRNRRCLACGIDEDRFAQQEAKEAREGQ